ncbi:DUF3450 family protein [Colwellia echini]|uniref:DUF3450 domain-containing protein n=1 Tax=Colwellia echini TaxID=1982103 RepID=A0ABY3MUU7_9GAMM|nr:DUF3450 family protein [Colwellia echini]TYK64982.1 DUF3450 domain-containing protein [Colwellia echini]
MGKKALSVVVKNILIDGFTSKLRAKYFSVMGSTCGCLLSFSALAVNTAQIEDLTQQWLDIEKQSVQLQTNWQMQQPILRQQITLLNEEKSQLTKMLQVDNSSQAQVEVKRSELLQQQNELEQQQQQLTNQLIVLNKQLLNLNNLLPPPLTDAWQSEDQVLDAEPTTSQQLQVSLAKLDKLNAFNQRISIHEKPLTAPNGNEILVKQFYLGLSSAWFTSANGEYRGWGQATDNGWQWYFDEQLSADAIQQAIAIFEKKQQADFVALPMVLQNKPVNTTNALGKNSTTTESAL